MKTQRKIILSALLALFFVTNVCSASSGQDASGGGLADKMKFGVHLGSILWCHKVGAFAEYKIHDAFGLRTGIMRFKDMYAMKALHESPKQSAVVVPVYAAVPLIARFYPGEARQFCMFAGLQVNYLAGGESVYFSTSDSQEKIKKKTESLNPFSEKPSPNSDLKNLKDESAQSVPISSWGSHLLMGFDYETLGGFQIGLEYGYGLSSLAACDEIVGNWTLKPTLGYNFAKLFD